MFDIVSIAESSNLSLLRESSSRAIPERPILKTVVIAVPLSESRLAIRNGTESQIAVIVQDSPTGIVARCLKLLDGTRSVSEIEAAIREDYSELGPGDLTAFLRSLGELDLLEDASIKVPPELSDDDLKRYSRNINCWSALSSSNSTKYQTQVDLGQATVLILGVGGIGSNCALGLAMLGVGHLILVDDDLVELQNLNRQVLYDTTAIGKYKVEAAAERLQSVNPGVDVTGIRNRIGSTGEIQELIRKSCPRIVVLAADRPAESVDLWTSQACVMEKIPYITGAVSGAYGQVWSKSPSATGCEECDRRWLESRAPNEHEMLKYRESHDIIPATSALSFGAQVVGGLIGYDILRYLLGNSMTSAGHMVTVDFFMLSTSRTVRPPHPNCSVCRRMS